MTKKDYIKVAEMLKARKDRIEAETKNDMDTMDELISETHLLEISIIAEQISVIFENDNPRFDRERFLIAYGYSQ